MVIFLGHPVQTNKRKVWLLLYVRLHFH